MAIISTISFVSSGFAPNRGYYIESNIKASKVTHNKRKAESLVGIITLFESIYDDGVRGN
jgi:hypothetical protein